ncbi:MAG: C40 family peptidase [Sphingobium sp.]|nr:C40 family peptidase [Sphingobium sp.]
MTIGDQIAAEALTLVGAPFRLRGRDPDMGLDCVGLVMVAARRAGLTVSEPPAYRLHGTSRARAETLLAHNGLVPAGCEAPGDVLLVESGPMQLHLMIRAAAGHVHAHAGLGRVVLMPPPAPWPVLGIWRVIPKASA